MKIEIITSVQPAWTCREVLPLFADVSINRNFTWTVGSDSWV